MRSPCCHSFLAFILKFLNFLQAFVGVAIVVYSAYMLSRWQHHHLQFQPPDAINSPLDFAAGVLTSNNDALRFNFNSLPAPWFIYAFMGVGILVCIITSIGYIGAEAMNGCFLCLYAVMTTIFILLEAGLVSFIALDHGWKKDIPFDPTGQLDSFRIFIEDNIDVFQWVGLAIIVIQALSLFLAIILRSLVLPRVDDDPEGDYGIRTGNREPLISPYTSQASASTRGDSDIWSSRMREKYGLKNSDAKYSSLNQNPATEAKP